MKSLRILITNGRYPITLDLIRNLASRGHQIYLAETQRWTLSHFSNAVKSSFTVPSPRFYKEEYIEALQEIIAKQGIDLFIPIWEDIFITAKYLKNFPTTCKVFCAHFEVLERLHNKYTFIHLLEELGISAPRTKIIHSLEDLQQIDMQDYVIKPCYGRGSSKVHRVNNKSKLPSIKASPEEPWIAQEWLQGKSYCSYSICNQGRVDAHTVYPVDFVMEKVSKLVPTVGSYCITFCAIEHKKIFEWVENFARKTKFTGQIAFDFIEKEGEYLYAIECNPRITSGISLFSRQDPLDHVFLGIHSTLIKPKIGTRKQIMIGNLIYGWRHAIACKKFGTFLRNFFFSKDLIFSLQDLGPFLCQPLLWFKYIYATIHLSKNMSSAFTHDIDYNGDA
jgi:biotin carboxylase